MKRHMKPLALTTCALLLSATLANPAWAGAKEKDSSFSFGAFLGGVAAFVTIIATLDQMQRRTHEDKEKRDIKEREEAKRNTTLKLAPAR